ncbi:MAG TPA: NAD+ synthase, partial [Phycisphaerales bacterium]|nr:NAD+ synthase [Phycisphaerales bacterium]
MRIALAQLNATVGDLEGNFNKMVEAYRRALDAGVDLLVFPEQFLCGYPTEDLLLKQHFLDHNLELVEKLAATCPKLTIVAGFAEPFGGGCRNSAAICRDGEIDDIYAKNALPNYGVFDERRYFEAGTRPVALEVAGVRVAMSVCFDMWNIGQLTEFLRPIGRFDLLLNISASPFHIGKIARRREIIKRCAAGFRCAAAYCNLVGGQDEIVFDGRSILADSSGRIVAEAAAFEEDMLIADVTAMDDGHTRIEPVG